MNSFLFIKKHESLLFKTSASRHTQQTIWNGAKFDKLREVEPIVKRPKVIHKLSRREEIVLARLRIGHTRIAHSHLSKREDQPKCIGCDTPFTVKHFLLECTDFAAENCLKMYPLETFYHFLDK